MRSDFTAKAKAEMKHRSQGWCEAQTKMCRRRAAVFHHVLGRGVGGKGRADNGLHLCDPCHKFIHANPALSYERGWMRRSGPVILSNGDN